MEKYLPLAPWSRAFICCISSPFKWKSNIWKFCWIRDGVTLFGITTIPSWIKWRSSTWAGVLLCLLAMETTAGSLKTLASRPGLKHWIISKTWMNKWINYRLLHETVSSWGPERGISAHCDSVTLADFSELLLLKLGVHFHLQVGRFDPRTAHNSLDLLGTEVGDADRLGQTFVHHLLHGLCFKEFDETSWSATPTAVNQLVTFHKAIKSVFMSKTKLPRSSRGKTSSSCLPIIPTGKWMR